MSEEGGQRTKYVMWQLRMAASGLMLGVLGLLAVSKADPIPSSHLPTINQAIEQRQLEALNSEIEDEKRAWNNLHGGWGKRGWSDMNSAWGKRAWQNLHGGWGKRGWQDMNSAWGKRGWKDMNSAWGKRGWKDMNSAWGKRAWDNLRGGWGKRQWEKLNGGWGKREADDLYDGSYQPNYDSDLYDSNIYDQLQESPLTMRLLNNKEAEEQDMAIKGAKAAAQNIKGAMDKREPGWNNLKGLWGKRSVPDYLDELQSEDRREE
ncbi:myoinhibiting peptide precursor [Arctopsyche grandis]|uniref:myoinhibiting peptide precursor n=1 Tax=Arctopsyche grandis TaxID=121162 RepID=UPI00406DA2AB